MIVPSSKISYEDTLTAKNAELFTDDADFYSSQVPGNDVPPYLPFFQLNWTPPFKEDEEDRIIDLG